MSNAYLLLGSNLGDSLYYLQQACNDLEELAGQIIQKSSLYSTPAWGFDEPVPDFVNQVVVVATTFSPDALLQVIKQIEISHGRVREQSTHYQSRTIDIDILLFDNLVHQTNELVIPHPRLPLRRFALTPLAEVAPHVQHPLMRISIAAILQQCTDNSAIKRIH